MMAQRKKSYKKFSVNFTCAETGINRCQSYIKMKKQQRDLNFSKKTGKFPKKWNNKNTMLPNKHIFDSEASEDFKTAIIGNCKIQLENSENKRANIAEQP